ncbi:MAG: hypothetical protein NTX25_23210 [Proteobacteria bacterium]|nr:hypothetical protein [Pseudomonadota bacterium]
MLSWIKRMFSQESTKNSAASPSTAEESINNEKIYKLRNMLLSSDPGQLGLKKDVDLPNCFALVSEFHLANVMLTLLTIQDGTTSLYMSNGAAIIGGGQHQAVRQANRKLLLLAQELVQDGEICKEFPFPNSSEVFFYLVCWEGVIRRNDLESAARQGKGELAPLYSTANELLSAIRAIEEGQKAPAK